MDLELNEEKTKLAQATKKLDELIVKYSASVDSVKKLEAQHVRQIAELENLWKGKLQANEEKFEKTRNSWLQETKSRDSDSTTTTINPQMREVSPPSLFLCSYYFSRLLVVSNMTAFSWRKSTQRLSEQSNC